MLVLVNEDGGDWSMFWDDLGFVDGVGDVCFEMVLVTFGLCWCHLIGGGVGDFWFEVVLETLKKEVDDVTLLPNWTVHSAAVNSFASAWFYVSGRSTIDVKGLCVIAVTQKTTMMMTLLSLTKLQYGSKTYLTFAEKVRVVLQAILIMIKSLGMI